MKSNSGSVLGGIVVFGAALRLYGLGEQSLWSDEIASVFLAGSSLPESLARVQLDVHPPLYFYLLSLWSAAFGTSEIALRLPSALAGTLAIALVFRVGSRLFGSRAGLAAAVLMALSTVEIYYSQEVRSYAFLVLFGLLSMDALTAGWLSGARRHFVYYALATTLVIYVHYFGFLLVLAQGVGLGLAWLLTPRDPNESRNRLDFPIASAVIALFAVALSFAPWFPVLLAQSGAVGSGFWIESIRPLDPLRTLAIFASLQRPPWGWLIAWPEIAKVFAVLAIGFGLLSLPGKGAWFPGADQEAGIRKPGSGAARIAFVLAWLVVPGLAAFAASWAGSHAYTHRNLLVSSPALFLLLGALFRALPGRFGPSLLAAAAVAPTLVLYPWYYGEPHKGQWREMTASVSALAGPGDGWVFDAPFIQRNFEFYRGEAPYRFVDLRERSQPTTERIWLVRDEGRNSGELVPKRLAAFGYRLAERRDFRGVDAWLYERAHAPGAPGSRDAP